MHSRLARQLRRHAAGVELPPALQPLLDGISAAFADIDRERALHGAAMDALSLEMTARYERLQRSEAEYRELSETLLAAERAHRDADARYRAIFENAGVAIFLLGWSGTITEVNEAACALLGYARAELLGRDASGFLLREDAASVSEPLGQLRSGLRDVVSIERRLRHREGHIVWVQLTGSVVELEGGRTLALVLQDITARKAMELQLVEQAFSDDLTGLANRALFRDRLRHALDRRARA
ncbi:MAG: PAS domain S-box protein, partial [Gemmatimonadaceae bacterium]|nr:PAS domain S-box protein [Gemmatimonadaceae bacterium]